MKTFIRPLVLFPAVLWLTACASTPRVPEVTPRHAVALNPEAAARVAETGGYEGAELFNVPTPSEETLWQIYYRTPVTKLTAEQVKHLEQVLESAGPTGIIEAEALSADEIGEPERLLISQWVYHGGVFWIRGDCSIENSFGVEWYPVPKRNPDDVLLIRSTTRSDPKQQIVWHPLNLGVYRLRIVKNGYFEPFSDFAKKSFTTILQDDHGALFAELPLGEGFIVFDSSRGDPRMKAPFRGIYGFDSGTFWLNFFRRYADLDEKIKTFAPEME